MYNIHWVSGMSGSLSFYHCYQPGLDLFVVNAIIINWWVNSTHCHHIFSSNASICTAKTCPIEKKRKDPHIINLFRFHALDIQSYLLRFGVLGIFGRSKIRTSAGKLGCLGMWVLQVIFGFLNLRHRDSTHIATGSKTSSQGQLRHEKDTALLSDIRGD